MSFYFDTSVIVSLFVRDDNTDRVFDWFATLAEPPIVSSWTVAEFTSALGLRRRLGVLDRAEREQIELALDDWLQGVELIEPAASDFALARDLMRSEVAPLKAPDALHLAIALRRGATLVSTDRQLDRAALNAGLEVADLLAAS